MKKISLILATSLLSVSFGFAQGSFKFKEETHDFGSIEEGTVATHEFEFTNTGKAPIIISEVQASCGCTTPSFTKEPVLPGKKGHIKASYNSSGRPGAFNKSITVKSNATEAEAVKVLFIKGTVNAKPKNENSPNLNLNKSSHNFGKIELGSVVSEKFTVSNSGKGDLTIQGITSACQCVTYTLSKATLKTGESANLILKYKPKSKDKAQEIITVLSNDENKSKMKIMLQAEVVESILRENARMIPFSVE